MVGEDNNGGSGEVVVVVDVVVCFDVDGEEVRVRDEDVYLERLKESLSSINLANPYV